MLVLTISSDRDDRMGQKIKKQKKKTQGSTKIPGPQFNAQKPPSRIPEPSQHGGQKPTETSVTEFCYKSVNLFFEKFISIKVILFLIHELFR